MFHLIQKELKSFFTSLSGYVILAFFLLANGLFLWVIPGGYNIFESGLADLQPFFALAPLLYLFLVPALCMRLFAEEKRAGTLELLFTRPVPLTSIVLSKYFAGLILVVFSILPTILYPIALSVLAQPAGYIDTGGVIGSYIGLFFLSAIYVAIGLWASSITENQVVAFLTGMIFSFLLYSGFDLVAEIPAFSGYRNLLVQLGIDYHYEPMSRGVLNLNDIVYFISIISLFLFFTLKRFKGIRWNTFVVVALLLLLNIFSFRLYYRLDITNDKRYTLSQNTRDLLKDLDRSLEADIFLAGNLPPGIQRIQNELIRMLEEFRRITGNRVRYMITDPLSIRDQEEKKLLARYLIERGIRGVNLHRTTEDDRLQQQIVFPGLVIYDDETEVSVNLLQSIPGYSPEENINYSIETLEYELTNAIRLITRKEKKSVAFLTGQGEYSYQELSDIANTLLYYYQVDFLNTDTLGVSFDDYEAVIIAGPKETFSEKDKYIIDQYVMYGGKVLWCIDEMKVEHDILKTGENTFAYYNPLNIEDLLFRYGIRINPDLLLDGNCARIPMVTGMHGNTPQINSVPWYYSPLLLPHKDHPVTNGIQPVRVDYANSIDTVGGTSGLQRTVLLASSEYSALVNTPAPISLAITEEKLTREKFNRSSIPVAVMTQGNFSSLFKFNRRYEEVVDKPFKENSEYNRMIVISDGNIIRNEVRMVGNEPRILPLGYDDYNDIVYGNKDFLLNCVNMLCDDEGWMQLRGRKLSLYLLDKTRLKSERNLWRLLNVGGPLVILTLAGGSYYFWRRRKFQKKIEEKK